MIHASPTLDLPNGKIRTYLDDSDDLAASILLWWQGASSLEPMQPLTDTSSAVLSTLEENTPPTGTDNSLITPEDQDIEFQAAHFGFLDAEDGIALSAVRIDLVPQAGGTLRLNGIVVGNGEEIRNGALGGLVFEPAVTTTGPGDGSFLFSVQDRVGQWSLNPNVMSILVTPIDRDLEGDPNGVEGPDTLVGGGGNDTLDGKTGADLMRGWGGNDTYYVDNPDDAIIEDLNGGHDQVFASASYTLPANVEDLFLTGGGRLNGVGNASDNSITGNSAANRLEGGGGNDLLDGAAGADTLTGGIGDDTYVVDDNRDKVNENSNQGTDTVRSSVARTLETHVENLELLGTASINGAGNANANVITGNDGANVLSGSGGDDIISGGGDNDVFDYNALGESTLAAPDEITDFADGDLIDLSGIDANTTTPKDQAFMLVAGFSNNPGELVFDSGTLMGDVNGDSVADFAILLAVGGVESTDFIL